MGKLFTAFSLKKRDGFCPAEAGFGFAELTSFGSSRSSPSKAGHSPVTAFWPRVLGMTGAAPDASVGAGSGNCPARQAGSFAGTAHRAVPKRPALHIAGPSDCLKTYRLCS